MLMKSYNVIVNEKNTSLIKALQTIRYNEISNINFWTELSCRRNNFSNKATLLLGWSHRNKKYTVVITIWLTVTRYLYLKWQWIFTLYVDVFFLYHCQYFYRVWMYIWVTRRVSYKKQELLTLCDYPSSPAVFCVRYHFRIKCSSVRLYLQLFVGGSMSYLR